jgi:TPR repeat protein
MFYDGRMPLDFLWRSDLRNGWVIWSGKEPIKRWSRGPFSTEEEAELARMAYGVWHPEARVSVVCVPNLTLLEMESIYRFVKLGIRDYQDKARDGCGRAEALLGFCFALGLGVKRDIKQARRLLFRRLKAGQKEVVFLLSYLREHLESSLAAQLMGDHSNSTMT